MKHAIDCAGGSITVQTAVSAKAFLIVSKLVFVIPLLAALLVLSVPPFTLTLMLAIPPLPVSS